MAQDSWIDCKTEPKGKRTVRRNIYGNLVGYIGRTQWECITGADRTAFSETESIAAQAWVDGDPDWQDAPYRG